ncbi:hypothetical protein [Rivihabitans pingtungensis]|jgi:hypothetical protein|uniref:hypothetical protein n=1 Tax=Rivihabitans pingtungensis TaxID=1054498 RepID=UPI002C014E57|nr:hypothetical protein [Rivihabitans pingtungensis]HNX71999.1 hypothetical protein [Rivihabitans pingtungensis]
MTEYQPPAKGTVMKKWILICAMLGAAAQTHAVVGSWSKQTAHYPIYFSGGYAEMPFNAPTSMPTLTSFITSVTYQWTGYGNGNTSRTVQICYSKKYSTVISNCWDISNRQQNTIHNFDGFDASGKFWIRHQIWGGTYPAVSSALDTVTVMHQ